MIACYIRHGETDWNLQGIIQGRRDIPLNDAGRRQSKAAGIALAGERWDRIIASPVSRATETASIIAERVGLLDVTTDPTLAERDYGKGEGMTYEQVQGFYGGEIPGLESIESVRSRMFSSLERFAGAYADERILVVSHGGSINALLFQLSGGTIGTGLTGLRNCGLTLISHDAANGYRIVFFNKET